MLPSGSDLAQASHQPGHIVPPPKRRKSLTKTPPASRPGLPFWIVKTWPKLTSLHFFVWKKRLHRVLTRILEHIWMYNRFCLEYICAEVASAFHDFFLLVFFLVLICPVLVVALLILLGHRTVNRDPCILYSRVGARRCMKRGFIKSRTGGSPITCVVSLDKLF